MTAKTGKFSLLIAAAAFLAACSLTPLPPVQLPARSSVTPGETITVYGNQNVYGIAKQYNVSMRELIVLNDIRPPFTLRPGQKLVLPANHVTPSDVFNPPSYASGNSASPAMASSPSYAEGPPPAPPVASSSGEVQSSELPPIQPAPVSAAPLPSPSAAPTSISPSTSVTPVPSSPVGALNAPSPAPKPVATTMENTQVASAEKPETPAPSVKFAWPVQGPILSGFGPKGQGLSNDGVNIGAPKDAPVVAAANGIVVYAGNEMKGFGNLVLIRHEGGWVTAYAHLGRVLVNKDAVVAQGDMIGTVGKTGNVSAPQLHFEIRYNGKPVDPATIIKTPEQ